MANITLITSGMTPREGMNTMNSNMTSIDADLTVFDVDDSTSETYEAIGPNAPSSSVLVGTSATQTLQNKTITSDNSVTGLGVAGDNILNIGRKDLHSTLIKFDSPEDNDNNYSSYELSVDDTNNVSTITISGSNGITTDWTPNQPHGTLEVSLDSDVQLVKTGQTLTFGEGNILTSGFKMDVQGQVLMSENLSIGSSVTSISPDPLSVYDSSDNLATFESSDNSSYITIKNSSYKAVKFSDSTGTKSYVGRHDDGTFRIIQNSLFGSTDGIVLSAGGNVGIHTDSGLSTYKLHVSGDTKVDGTFLSTGNVDFDSNLNVDGNSTLVGSLGVTGISTLSDDLYVSGNQGIGTVSPTVSGLDIDVTSTTGNILRVKNSGTGSFISFEDQDSTFGYNWIGTESNNLIFKTNNAERVWITDAGKIGINTNDPNQALEVNGSIRISNTDARLEIHDTSGDDFRIQNQNGTLKFVNSTSEREDIAITGDGRVGINESTPEGKLHVYLSNDTSNDDVSAVFEGEDHSIVRIKGTGQRTVNFVDSDSSLDWLTGMDDSNGSGGDASDYVIKQTANSVPEFIIDTSGKVGVNTNNPERMLDVYSTSLNLGFRVQDPTSYIMTSTIAGSPVLEMQDDDGSAFLRFKKGSNTDNDVFLRAYDGKIGISNSQEFTPAADIMLHVNGRIKAEGIVSAGTINIEDLIVSNSFTASELTVTESLIINSLTSPSSSDIEVNKSIDFRGNDLKDASLVQSQLFQIKPSDVSPAYHAPFTTIIVPYNSGNGRHFMTDSPGAVGWNSSTSAENANTVVAPFEKTTGSRYTYWPKAGYYRIIANLGVNYNSADNAKSLIKCLVDGVTVGLAYTSDFNSNGNTVQYWSLQGVHKTTSPGYKKLTFVEHETSGREYCALFNCTVEWIAPITG